MKISFKKIGLLANILVATVLLFLSFGKILRSPNEFFFAQGGDGLKSSFGSYYLLQYDTAYFHTNCMGYPYGESVFFTGDQPLIVNTFKCLKNIGIDAQNNMIGILNFWMLVSIVIGSIFIYLLLIDLKLPWYYSIAVANIIAFLSPQMGRLGGHFDLAYLYFLPLFLLLLKKFFDKPSIKISILTAFVLFFTLGTHAYFYALYAFWIFFLLIYAYVYEKERFNKISHLLLHLVIQIAVPYVIFSLFTIHYANDRSAFPWGFFNTRSFPEAVFLPLDKPYSNYLNFSYINWEGLAYVGLVSSITTVVLLIRFFKSIRFKNKFSLERRLNVTDHHFLNALLIGAVVALMISFAYPFQWHLQKLLNYTGPFRQFRASGRFNWLFYYTINLISYYLIWKFYEKKKTLFAKVLIILALGWGSYDAYLNIKGKEHWLSNHNDSLKDLNNELPENRWINKINTADYQAILSFPFFHVGSETYWIINSDESVNNGFISSWKTGLPLFNVMLSRTSLSHSMSGLEFYFEPLAPFSILNDLPNHKDILLLKTKKGTLNQNEERFFKYALLIEQNEILDVYQLTVDSIIKLQADYTKEIISQVNAKNDTLLANSNSYIHQSFGSKQINWPGEGEHPILNPKHASTFLDTTLISDTAEITISFWMKDLNKDIIPRSTLKVGTRTQNGAWQQKSIETLFRLVKYVGHDGWGLVEFTFKPEPDNTNIRLEIWNDLVTSQTIEIDEILIRESTQDVFYKGTDFVYKNNRFIKLNSLLYATMN